METAVGTPSKCVVMNLGMCFGWFRGPQVAVEEFEPRECTVGTKDMPWGLSGHAMGAVMAPHGAVRTTPWGSQGHALGLSRPPSGSQGHAMGGAEGMPRAPRGRQG